MIANDFKAINAAMKANEQPTSGVTFTLTALDVQAVIKKLQERQGWAFLPPCIAAVQFTEVASRNMQDCPVRDFLGDPEC